MEATQLLELGKYGVVGVLLALIFLAGFLAWLLFKVVTNHVEHSNIAFNENTKALQKLVDIIEIKIK